MYVTQAKIANLRSIRYLLWTVPQERLAGWHVIIGDNGSGKTTFLRGISLALLGFGDALALRQDWRRWLRVGAREASIELSIKPSQSVGAESAGELGFFIVRMSDSTTIPASGEGPVISISDRREQLSSRCFSAAYGPFRRFTGGDRDEEEISSFNPRLAAHLSLFGENVALTDALSWLQDLRFKELEGKPGGVLLTRLRKFINQEGFLPFGVRLSEISSSGVDFTDGNGCPVSVLDLSDGYRSVLSMTFELIRQMVAVYGSDRVFDPADPTRVIPPGVVLIDEVDAHLHPSWQRQIGKWFTKHFPNIQFIVTTHSPLVCQAAEYGTVFRLPRPGTEEAGEMVTGRHLERLVFGNVLDAYGTDLFGESVEQSDTARERQKQLARLNVKELREGLTEAERREQEALRVAQPTAAGTLATVAGEDQE